MTQNGAQTTATKETNEQKAARLAEEREFHDRIRLVDGDPGVSQTRWSPELEKTIQENPLWSNMKYYSVERRSRNFVTSYFDMHAANKDVLDLCCGNGEDSLYMARIAKSVTGLDISPVSIENCARQAQERLLAEKAFFVVGDAEKTGFPDNSFDLVSEYGALHHVDTQAVFREIARVLRPGGSAICTECLGHNPVIHAYRKLTPQMRTANEVERILKRRDILGAKQWFDRVEIHLYHLFTIAATPFRNTPVFKLILAALETIDRGVLSMPGIRWWAWQSVFVLSGPKKSPKTV